jgi:hypothetical protein
MRRIAALCALLIIWGIASGGGRAAQAPDGAADAAFHSRWARADAPVAAGTAGRSWLWGPEPVAVANEPWAEAAGGRRLVQYWDKARMEINDPHADPADPYYVTTGLIVVEMVTGQVQTGEARFESRQAAEIPVAGDGNDPEAPTYAGFAGLLGLPPTGAPRQRLARDGSLSAVEPPGPLERLQPAYTDPATGHSVPAVFWTWMNSSGPVREGDRLVMEPVFDWLSTLGRPISEAYWVAVRVGGAPQVVLAQLFERRVLTYNPANPPVFQIEMGNVGRHYYDWRYGASGPGPAIALDPPPGPNSPFAVRGWNWPAGPIELAAGPAAAGFGPALGQATADDQGRFSLILTLSQELFDQYSRAPGGLLLMARTPDGAAQTALPLVVRPLPPTPTPLPPTPPPTRPPGERQVIVPLEGVIVSVDPAAGSLRFDIPENEIVLLQTDAGTRITVGGAPAGLADLRPGQPAVVHAVLRPPAPDGAPVYRLVTLTVP